MARTGAFGCVREWFVRECATRLNRHLSPKTNDARHFIECCIVDFKDAFYTPHPSRGMASCFGGITQWVVFLCVAFFLTSGPLLWGRFAASVARFAQSLMARWELGMQVYVDDPTRIVLMDNDCDSSLLYFCSWQPWASTKVGPRATTARESNGLVANSTSFGMESQYNSQTRESRLERTTSMKSFTSKP